MAERIEPIPQRARRTVTPESQVDDMDVDQGHRSATSHDMPAPPVPAPPEALFSRPLPPQQPRFGACKATEDVIAACKNLTPDHITSDCQAGIARLLTDKLRDSSKDSSEKAEWLGRTVCSINEFVTNRMVTEA